MNLARLLNDLIDEISIVYPGRSIKIEAESETRGRWDSARLSQALGNLIGNAVQHGAVGTTVTLRLTGTADEVMIAVHNRGVSIPASDLDGIFNPLKARSSMVRETAAKGPTGSLGLGLYIAERIVSAHQGRIEVESNDAHGTTFTVTLPRGEVARVST
jgi:signal transduction histidine kinase